MLFARAGVRHPAPLGAGLEEGEDGVRLEDLLEGRAQGLLPVLLAPLPSWLEALVEVLSGQSARWTEVSTPHKPTMGLSTWST